MLVLPTLWSPRNTNLYFDSGDMVVDPIWRSQFHDVLGYTPTKTVKPSTTSTKPPLRNTSPHPLYKTPQDPNLNPTNPPPMDLSGHKAVRQPSKFPLSNATITSSSTVRDLIETWNANNNELRVFTSVSSPLFPRRSNERLRSLLDASIDEARDKRSKSSPRKRDWELVSGRLDWRWFQLLARTECAK